MKVVSHAFLGGFLFVVAGCAHSSLNREIDSELQKVGSVTTYDEFVAQGKSDIQSSRLTAQEKQKLEQVHQVTKQKMVANEKQESRLRAVLVRALVEKDFKQAKVDLIVDRLKELNAEKLSIRYEALRNVRSSLGRPSLADSSVYQHIWHADRSK